MRSVELFSGAGGMALGLARAGFRHELLVEWNRAACDTLEENKRRGVEFVRDWAVLNKDARSIDYSELAEKGVDLLAGGPPCQPFSIGGKHRGPDDERDMWGEAIRAVREIRPKVFLFENVRGLLREAFADYLRYLVLHLEMPEFTRRRNEDWRRHLARLDRAARRQQSPTELRYHVSIHPVNAADYGVPQTRRRVFIVGVRNDLGAVWNFPEPTHSREALLWAQWVTGEYWERHRISRRCRPEPSPRDARTIERLRSQLFEPTENPWVTTRDAISDLPKPGPRRPRDPNHVLQPGARAYPGHTGSRLDEPAKALKAGDHGVPGGENMLALPDGTVRYFTVREAARLQGFPDDFVFPVSWTESMRQIGNAVPVTLAQIVAQHLRNLIEEAEQAKQAA